MVRKKLRYLIIFYGRPGCGKGTNAEKLATSLGIHIFSGSDALSKYIDDPSTPKAEIRYIKLCMKKGFLVMDKVMAKAFAFAMVHTEHEVMIFDGVPRTPEQAPWLDLPDTIRVVIHLELSKAEALARSAKRLKEALERQRKADAAGETLARHLRPRPDDQPEEALRRQGIFDASDTAMTVALENLATPGHYLKISAHDEVEDPQTRQARIHLYVHSSGRQIVTLPVPASATAGTAA